jgi:Leucine-rich repeat (LRR) protein
VLRTTGDKMNIIKNKLNKRVVWITGIMLVGIFSGLLQQMTSAAIPSWERKALIALYKNTNGELWTDRSGWKEGTLAPDGFSIKGSETFWSGIKVKNGHVTEIRMIGNGLKGTLPSELGDLDNLQVLWLPFNSLRGNLPRELGKLQALERIYLEANQLSGRIPAELGNLGNLLVMDFTNNHLSGSIPPALGNLSRLEYLRLSTNQLSGTIPVDLRDMRNLHTLILRENNLSGSIPREFGDMHKLATLDLEKNQLTGHIPRELGNLSLLWTLILSHNNLTGSIPSDLGRLGHLWILYLDHNKLTELPEELGYLPKLEYLRLNSNKLKGRVPDSFTNLTMLENLEASINYNALITNNESLRELLSLKTSKWEDTQTLAVSDLTVTSASSSTVSLSWTPIAYSEDSGAYKIYYSTSRQGEWVMAGKTKNKAESSFTLKRLSPGTTYYFTIKTVTHSHPKNSNTINSDLSETTSIKTDLVGF